MCVCVSVCVCIIDMHFYRSFIYHKNNITETEIFQSTHTNLFSLVLSK